MADDNFRSYRNRDTSDSWQADDPLAELARLIGQKVSGATGTLDDTRADGSSRDRYGDDRRGDDRYGTNHYGNDRYAGERTIEPSRTSEEYYDARRDDRYEPAQYDDAVSSYRPGASSDAAAYETRDTGQAYAPAPRFDDARDDGYDRAASEHDAEEQPESFSRQPPVSIQPGRDEHYEYDDRGAPQEAGDPTYDLEDYAEEAPATRRRSGVLAVAAVLALAVLGTAGAFAYRAMFGGSMLPSLPPIIKADSGPNKIVPAKPKSNSDQADAGSVNSGEKIVSREEQPVDMPTPVNPAPRVVSTIPIFPDPNSTQAGVPNVANEGALAANGPSSAASAAPLDQASGAPAAPAASIWPPAPAVASAPSNAAPPMPAAGPSASTGPRKVHTVVVHSDQTDTAIAAAPNGAPAPAAMPQPAQAPAPVRTASPRVAAQPPASRPAPAPAPRTTANGPLSIVPDQGGSSPAPAAPRVRTALTQPAATPEPAAAETGGYAVQVTSQRSEAEALAEFRALRSKYPAQFGGHQPIVRRADLGAKGIYYRALVGPFASAEQAATMCSSLKAAGGSCIVQRN